MVVADLDEHVQPPGGQTVPGFLGSVDEMGYSLVHGAWVDRLAETGELGPVSTSEAIGEFTFISVRAIRVTSCFVYRVGEREDAPAGVRRRVRLRGPTGASMDAGDKARGRAVLRGADQRNHRVRGSRGAGVGESILILFYAWAIVLTACL